MKKRNDMDEMQKEKAMRIGRNGYYIAMIGLTLSIIIQSFMRANLREIIFEAVLAILLAGYTLVAYIRNGLTTRNASYRMQAILSGFGIAIFTGITSFMNFPFYFREHLMIWTLLVAGAFLLTFFTFKIVYLLLEKKRKRLEEE